MGRLGEVAGLQKGGRVSRARVIAEAFSRRRFSAPAVYHDAVTRVREIGASMRDMEDVAPLSHPEAPRTLHETREKWAARNPRASSELPFYACVVALLLGAVYLCTLYYALFVNAARVGGGR